jgi:thiol-disulfide isomerase/thioredoxin
MRAGVNHSYFVLFLLCFITSATDAKYDVKQYDPRRHKTFSNKKKNVGPTAIHVIWDKHIQLEEWTKVVSDKSKHVVVWFSSPWSGRCKKLAPTFEALARAHAKKEVRASQAAPDSRLGRQQITVTACHVPCCEGSHSCCCSGFRLCEIRCLPKHGAREEARHSVLPDHQIFSERAQG